MCAMLKTISADTCVSSSSVKVSMSLTSQVNTYLVRNFTVKAKHWKNFNYKALLNIEIIIVWDFLKYIHAACLKVIFKTTLNTKHFCFFLLAPWRFHSLA